jgi:hypothetical protein
MSKTRKLLVDKRKLRRQKFDHARETRYFVSPLVSCARWQARIYSTIRGRTATVSRCFCYNTLLSTSMGICSNSFDTLN